MLEWRESEAVDAAGLGCADAGAHGLADLCSGGYVALFHDLTQHGGSAGHPPFPSKIKNIFIIYLGVFIV